MAKKMLALLLLITALVLGYLRIQSLKPAPPAQAPPAIQEFQRELEYEKQVQQEALDAFVQSLEADRQESLRQWMAWSYKGKSKEERQAHRKRLGEILDREERKTFYELHRERRDAIKDIQQSRKDTWKNALGEAEYEQMQKLARQRHEMIQARKKAAQEQKEGTTP